MQQGFRGVGKVSFIQNPPPPQKSMPGASRSPCSNGVERAAWLSTGFGEQRGWRNLSCVVTPQNPRVPGQDAGARCRGGGMEGAPLLRPLQRKPAPPQRRGLRCRRRGVAPLSGEGAAPIAGGKGGGRGRRRMRGRPSPCTGQRGGRGAGAGSPPLRAGAGGRHRRGGRALPPAAIGPARPGSAPSGGPGPAAPYPLPAFKPPVPAGRSVRGSTGGDDPLRAVSTAPGTCGTGNRYRLRPRRAPAAVPGAGGAGDGGGGTAVTRAGRIGDGNNAAVTAAGCGHRGCGGRDWGWGTSGCVGVRGAGRRAAL